MNEIFNETVLNHLYESSYEEFEQKIHNTKPEVKKIESEVGQLEEKIVEFLKKVIPNKNNCENAINMFNEYELKYLSETDFWVKEYFKFGFTYRKILVDLILKKDGIADDNDTFFNHGLNNFSEWVEEQKCKYTFGTEKYKGLQNKYKEISEKYPNTTKVFEDLENVILTKEEIKALVELRDIDIAMGDMEKYLCFKLGMKEVLYF